MFPYKPAKFPWNDWYHVMCHTYGTWLPGDPKGFRTRHHREQVEGDYGAVIWEALSCNNNN